MSVANVPGAALSCCVALGLLAGSRSCQRQHLVHLWTGDADRDFMGVAVAAAGDIDHDGGDDVIVASIKENDHGADSGSVRVFSGRTGLVLLKFDGEAAGDQLGVSVAGGGDADGDGFNDVLAGAERNDKNGFNCGSARLISGKTGLLLRAIYGDTTDDLLGHSVAFMSDVDGDGGAELLIGAVYDDRNGTNSGSAFLYSGKTGALLRTHTGDSATDAFGDVVCRMGDTNGDGIDEYAINAPDDDAGAADAGSVYVFDGATGAKLVTIVGDAQVTALGLSLAGAGDVDGDGAADLLIGNPFDSRAGPAYGSVWVVSGATGVLLLIVNGTGASSKFGWSVSRLGDANFDGTDDFLVGVPAFTANETRLISGANGAILWVIEGTNDLSEFGTSVAGVGRLKGIPSLDFAIGAPLANDPRPGVVPGRVFAYRVLPVPL